MDKPLKSEGGYFSVSLAVLLGASIMFLALKLWQHHMAIQRFLAGAISPPPASS